MGDYECVTSAVEWQSQGSSLRLFCDHLATSPPSSRTGSTHTLLIIGVAFSAGFMVSPLTLTGFEKFMTAVAVCRTSVKGV